MVEKEMNTIQVLCDCCKEKAVLKCQICGADLCKTCYGKVVTVDPTICINEIGPPFTYQFEFSKTCSEAIHDYYKNCPEGIFLCPVHYQEIKNYFNSKVTVIVQNNHGSNITR